jgi:polysaccharide biosynthesis transport protein
MNDLGQPIQQSPGQLNSQEPGRESSPHNMFQNSMNPLGAGELDLRELVLTLWRRKMVIISTMALITVLTALTVLQLTPRYTTTSNVMLETRQSNVVDMESVMSGMSSEMATVLSEVEVIKSSSLIRRVVKKLNLTQDPEFNGDLKSPPWYAQWLDLETYIPRETLQTMGLRKPESMDFSPEETAENLESKVVDAVIKRLSVTPVRRSLVISISFESDNARKAALIANTIADNYIVDQLEVKFEATRLATSWLNDRIGTLRAKVKTSETAVQNYKLSVAGKIGQSSNLTTQQMGELNTQMILASTQRAEARARLEQVEGIIASQGDLNSAAEVLNSPLIQNLRDQEAQLLRKISELESRYGDRHPKMIKAKAEIKDLVISIEREVKKIIQSLRNEMGVAKAREGQLQSGLRKLESESGRQNKASIVLRELEREAEANRLLYENFLSRFKETSEQQDLQQADSRVISKADVPIFASYPKKKLTVLIALLGSAMLGVGLVFLMERLDNNFRSAEQIEQMTGVPAIGMVPLVSGLLSRVNMAQFIASKPTSSLSESIRSLRTSLLLSNVDNPPKVVSVTSTVPAEGKSTLAMWLAQIAAMSGQKVLLVDCDLRRPSVHRSMEIDNTLSLVEYLAEDCTLEEAIKKDPVSGVYVLPAKTTQANALDLLSSDHMARSIKVFRNHFDFVVLDAPPILAVSDSKIIGQMVDKMLYVVKWNETPRGLVQAGLRAAKDANLELAGVVMSQVNLKKHSRYGYGDSGYYYGKYKDYYTN